MRVLKTIFTLLAGAVLGIIAFVAVIFKVSKKVANVMDMPEFIVNSVKDMIVSFMSELLYADKDVLKVQRKRVDRDFINCTSYYDYRQPVFTFPTYDKADAFCEDVWEAYQKYGMIKVAEVKELASEAYKIYSVDEYYGWTSIERIDEIDGLIKSIKPYKTRTGKWEVRLPRPVKLREEAW